MRLVDAGAVLDALQTSGAQLQTLVVLVAQVIGRDGQDVEFAGSVHPHVHIGFGVDADAGGGVPGVTRSAAAFVHSFTHGANGSWWFTLRLPVVLAHFIVLPSATAGGLLGGSACGVALQVVAIDTHGAAVLCQVTVFAVEWNTLLTLSRAGLVILLDPVAIDTRDDSLPLIAGLRRQHTVDSVTETLLAIAVDCC